MKSGPKTEKITGAGGYCTMRRFMTKLLTAHYPGDQINESKMGGAFGTYERR